MGDLISKKTVLDLIKEELKQDRPDDFKIRNIERFINDLPCSYSVEKVIEQAHQVFIDELNIVLKDIPEGTPYTKEAHRVLSLNKKVNNAIRNGGKE